MYFLTFYMITFYFVLKGGKEHDLRFGLGLRKYFKNSSTAIFSSFIKHIISYFRNPIFVKYWLVRAISYQSHSQLNRQVEGVVGGLILDDGCVALHVEVVQIAFSQRFVLGVAGQQVQGLTHGRVASGLEIKEIFV